jgi:hypothetical protein
MTPKRAAQSAAVSRCRLVQLGRIDERRGSLCVAEHIPFDIQRVYWVFGVPSDAERAHHAHRVEHELLLAASGAFTVHCDDGHVRSSHRLDTPEVGLLLPEMVWHHLDEFSDGALCLVLASGPYDPDEYVSDYDEFRELMG